MDTVEQFKTAMAASGYNTNRIGKSLMENETQYPMAAEYIRRLTGDENTPVTFQVFDDTPAKDKSKARVYNGTLAQWFDRLRHHNEKEACGIFCTVNQTDLRGRGEDNIVGIRAILADDDVGANTVDGFPLRPHMAVRSSRVDGTEKRQFYWMTESGDPSQYNNVINRLVQNFHADPGCKGINRVLRVPGFYHQKDPNNRQLVEIIHMTDDLPYSWEQVVKAFPPIGNGSSSKNKLQEAFNSDPILNHLRAGGYVKEECPDGKIHIVCPFEEKHTTESSVSSTTYFIAHTNGYKHGHFKCQHGHCAERTRDDFLRAIGYTTEEYPPPTTCELGVEPKKYSLPSKESLRITADALATAKLTPPCIVQNYLYCDVGSLVAPGGTGKTTLMLHEMVHIVLNRPLYGLDICRPGWCLYVTAEDTREILIARLREIMVALKLNDHEQRAVRESVLPWDVTGETRRLIEVRDGNIILTNLADEIVTAYRNEPPVIITFDPTVSFGASEGMVNDNEQGLITAARRIKRDLGCCVRFVAHTGKAQARDKVIDQYASRGGTALPDGGRMTAVMQTWQPGDNRKLPPGMAHTLDSSITYLARAKLSYAPPNLPLIWIKRTGWAFEHVTETPVSDEEREKALLDQIERFIHSEVRAGRYHTKNTLESGRPDSVTRTELRRAVDQLIVRGRVVEMPLPEQMKHGGRKAYLTTADLAKCGEVP